MIWQVEVVRRDRWAHGPLDLAFLHRETEGLSGLAIEGMITEP